ncbi:MAG: hypothetical protein ACI4JT_06820 [Oscillospiraceae bacterium]
MIKLPKAHFIGICLNVYKDLCKIANNVGDDFSFSPQELSAYYCYRKHFTKRVIKKLVDMQLLDHYYKNRYRLQRFTKSTLAYFIYYPDRVLQNRLKSSESVSSYE